MDPGSIAGLALAAGTALLQASATLYQFIETTRRYETSVLALRREIDGLAQLVDAIKDSLDQDDLVAVQQTVKAPRGLWTSLRSELVSSELVGKQLCEIVGRCASKRRRFWSKPMAAMRLQISKDDVATMRGQALAHKGNLQCSLSMINLHLACQHPNQTRRLESRIEELLTNLSACAESSSHQRLPHGIEGVAKEMLSGASIVVETSERASVFNDDATVTSSIRNRINDWLSGVDAELKDTMKSQCNDNNPPLYAATAIPEDHEFSYDPQDDTFWLGSMCEMEAFTPQRRESFRPEQSESMLAKTYAITSDLAKEQSNSTIQSHGNAHLNDFLEAS